MIKNSPQERDPVCRLLRTVIEAFTDHNDTNKKLVIENEPLGRYQNISVFANIDEYGKVIGAGGIMVKALKKIALYAGGRLGRNVRLTVIDPKVRGSAPLPKFKEAVNWDNGPITGIMAEVCENIFTEPVELEAVDGSETTLLTVTIDAADKLATIREEIQEALSVIFIAIGKSQGRNEVIIDVQVTEKKHA